eukprot:CAMPEP_0174851380 /NCGR_PEP_ID=MMETSP1114-20130205/23158_1 /TAXON_ID=312471 /ORGANISM="Neobodo designis, Strain CCAP 1951/1" /LENGTH=628 /DNA_ID=CAMNT_0016085915 /DNA_START=28 /DNA_END=1910 /DNA_ORIENTATION=+
MAQNELFTCDLCPKAVFHSRDALVAHVDERHSDFVPDREALQSMTEMIRPMHASLAEKLASKWAEVGSLTFEMSSARDAGEARLNQACEARAQLELVARKWRRTAEVYVFGSSVAMGVWDGLSDIDCTVVDPAALDAGDWPPNEKAAVRALASLLRSIGFSHTGLEAIEHARVPIIKHNAQLPAIKILGHEYEQLLSRSIRCVFDQPQSLAEREAFERDLRGSIGELAVETCWWDPDARSSGFTLVSTTKAVEALIFVASKQGATIAAAPLHNTLRPELFHVDFDLSFRTFGIRNSYLLRSYLTAHRCGRAGALVLKDWSKKSGVNNSINGFLTSYAVNILWIYFLVAKGHVPYVAPQSIPQSLTAGHHAKDPKYERLIQQTIANDSGAISELHAEMGRLLYEFFAFYCFEFDWANHVVSLNREGVTTKAELGWTERDEVRLSRRNVRYLMCIEDPYEENLNLGRHLGENRSRKVMAELQRGLTSLVKDSAASLSLTSGAAPKRGEGSPKLADVTKLLACAACGGESFTEESFQELLRNSCADELERTLRFWTWDELVRRLGFKQVSGHVFPVRPVSNRKPPSLQSVRRETNRCPTSTADKLVADFVASSARMDAAPVPEWVAWRPAG